MNYKGYDVICSDDEGGYYAQDFNKDKQPVSKIYQTIDDLKRAIDNGTIKLK